MTRLAVACALIAAVSLPLGAVAQEGQGATPATIAANARFAESLPWSDTTEDALARRGFVATRQDPLIRDATGRTVMDLSAYDFMRGPAPPTANPSLWRHGALLSLHGLFQVAPRIWQVRGFDISNMTVIEGETSFIVIDPLTTVEVASAAMELVRAHVGDRPVVGVLYTHSHADHFGGVKGVIREEDVRAGRVQVVAPAGFMEHAVSENLIAGPAMSRRAQYQFGTTLQRGPAGQAGAGIGSAVSSGTISLIGPTREIHRSDETMTIDGVAIAFQVTPGTEAPAEMNIYFPDLRALCLAENANVTMHNILPPRGALVRDSKAWADYLTEAEMMFGLDTDVMFASHGWPRWGREAVWSYVGLHRDAYKYLHDQSVRLMNRGLNAAEVAETIALPDVLARQWFNRGYYGTMSHNAKAVYQRYLGWYDANPANLHAWPPEEAGRRYVAAMGGARRALRTARRAFEAGDYRWSAEVASRIVFADPSNSDAREVLAGSFEQMGYQAESMLWRNMYLTGAAEARQTPSTPSQGTVAIDMIAATSSPQLFDLLAIRLDPLKAAGQAVTLDFVFPERNEKVRVEVRNSVLLHRMVPMISAVALPGTATATVTMPRAAFLRMLFAGTPPAELVAAGVMRLDGDAGTLRSFGAMLDPAGPATPFPIVTP
jgi:alkyl sulfatase BDS1-like metallo-beta-lactamase superfamily hydrolase